ncbi:MAG: hypothetical protein RSO15_11160 [Bacteroides sp.]|uniref:hypothetical protein n=1 Tax=Bacteroides sp. TaxID=29523 RepID=UPI002FCA5A2B
MVALLWFGLSSCSTSGDKKEETDSTIEGIWVAADLSLEQVNTIWKVLSTRSTAIRQAQVSALAQRGRTTLSLPESRAEMEPATLLHTLVRDHQYYALEEL